MGNLTGLLHKIVPAIDAEKVTLSNRTGSNAAFVNNVTENNVRLTIERMRKESSILAEMEQSGAIKITGGLYEVESGKVKFFD